MQPYLRKGSWEVEAWLGQEEVVLAERKKTSPLDGDVPLEHLVRITSPSGTRERGL